ncbi:MAG: CopG family ribbon-helix-helix protein [Candidatus Cryptobacteroides sp.]
MGKRRTTRPQFIGIRLTDDELADLDRLMAEAGYRNRSLFVRDRIFAVKVGSRRISRKEDTPATSAGMEKLIWHVRRIGQNINRSCASINTMMAREGSSLQNARALEYWLKKISGYLFRIDTLLNQEKDTTQ